MRLMMAMGLRPEMTCRACGRSEADHDPSCPRALAKKLITSQPYVRCPRCGNSVAINTDDHYECRKCATVYVAGYGAGFDVEKAEKEQLFVDEEEFVNVAIAPYKGRGDFPVDKRLSALRAEFDRIVAEKKKG